MSSGIRYGVGQRVAGEATAALLRSDVPDVSDDEVEMAVKHVRRSIAAMPASNRLAVDVASGAVLVVLSVMVHTWFPRASPTTQMAALARLSRIRAPVVVEFFKLTKGLGLVAVFESRSVAARP